MSRRSNKPTGALPQKALATIVEHELMAPGDRVLVAVSGGIDSVVLLRLLSAMAQRLKVTVLAAHLNHTLRGSESDADEEFVKALCSELGVPLCVERVDVGKAAEKDNIEEAAREARAEFLQRAAADVHAGKIALGHTADDQVETFLLNLLRGSGLDGLNAMPYTSQNGFVRPLLDIWRQEIARYAAQESIEYREDRSNLDTAFARNRIRHRLLPALAEEYNPQIKSRLLRTLQLLKADSQVIEAVARRAFEGLATQTEGGLLLDAGGFSRLQVGVARRVARMAVEEVAGTLHDVESVHIEEVVTRLAKRVCGRLQLPGAELELAERGSDLLFSLYAEPPEAPEFEYDLGVPGSVEVPEAGATITGSLHPRPVDLSTDGERTQVALDLRKIEGRLIVRSRRPGDRIAPLGMGGRTKSISDILTDRKVAAGDRTRLCLVCDSRRVIWLVGHVLSELVKITPETEKTLVLRLVWGSGETG